MNARELVEKFQRQMESGSELNWREARDQIHAVHETAITEAERVICLSLHKAIFDAVERSDETIRPEKMEEFRKVRKQDYNLLLVSEAIIGRTDGLVDPAVMKRIADREVAAGRLQEDDELRKLTVKYGADVAETKPRTGFLSSIKSWFS